MTPFVAVFAALASGKHNMTADTLALALMATSPTGAESVLAELSEINYTDLSSRTLTTVSAATDGGVFRVIVSDKLVTATGDAAAFRFFAIYNATAPAHDLIAWGDIGEPVTLHSGQGCLFAFDQVAGILALAGPAGGQMQNFIPVDVVANHSAAAWEFMRIDTSGGNVTATLPDAAAAAGAVVIAKKVSTDSNLVSIDTTGAALIDGVDSIEFDTPMAALSFVSDGTDWSLI